MVLAPDLALLYAAYTLLNLLLTALVLGVRPRRTANVVVAVLFLGNALFGARQVIANSGDDVAFALFSPAAGSAWDMVVNLPTLAALIALPFLFPTRRLSRRWERALLATLTVWVAAQVGLVLALGDANNVHYPNNFSTLWSSLGAFTPYHLGVAVGVLVLLDTYLSAPSRILRDQTRYLLMAYGMKAASIVALVGSGVLGGAFPGVGLAAPATPPWLAVLWLAALLVAVLAIPVGLAASRWRARRAGEARTRAEDGFVLGGLGLGFVLALGVAPSAFADTEYILIRPLLIAYGVLQYQLLEVDLRTRRGTVAATYLTGLAAVFLVTSLGLQDVGIQPGLATGLGFVVAVGIGGLLAWPVLRAVLREPVAGPDPRGLDLYRAALEEAVAAKEGHATSEDRVLRSLRARLQISDREHALLEASVRSSFGKPADGLAPGARFLNRYGVEAQLGEGGFGRAFLARDEQMGRRVVLKAARAASPQDAKRMLREARLLASLDHPNIVRVHDVELVGESVVLVLEHVEGGSLADKLRAGALEPVQSLRLVDDMLAGLEAAHAAGIVHRDLKPANILLSRDGRAKLADFGVARAPPGTMTVTGFSVDGQQPGSLHYMSPEQVRGRDLDARSDLYSLGVVWYEMLAGKSYLDLRGAAEFDARLAILEQKPALPLAGVPASINALLAQCLAKAPAKRPASASEVRARLGQVAT